jgi:rhodanese-related sulfurtransferase
MKKIIGAMLFVLLIIAGSVLNAGCSRAAPKIDSTPEVIPQTANVSSITIQDAYKLIQDNRDNPGFIIVDVRTADEFSSGHLANAVNIDFYSPDFKSNIDKLDRNKEYLIYCRTGIRGAAAIKIMKELGFTRVYNLAGGIVQWIDAGYPVLQ